MRLISNFQMFGIIRTMLNMMDSRLTEHGLRVGYIVLRLLLSENKHTHREIARRCVIAVLHDIGAFKTDEVDNLIEFDSTDTHSHCAYGYLFIKHLSPLAYLADSIYYHHTDITQLSDCKNCDLASLLNLADRIDIVKNICGQSDFSFIEKNLDKKFNREWYMIFKDNEQSINDGIASKSYAGELSTLLSCFEDAEYFSYLKMLIYSIDFRSPVTAMHTFTTAAISVELAVRMGLSNDEVDKIYYGAMLHDVGKIETPLEILEKQGRLTPTEIVIMQHHVVASREILSPYIDEEIVRIAARHHEKLNGVGYPDKLTEKDLTLSEKIVGVADIMSALLTKRSYKEIFEKDKVLHILITMSRNGSISKQIVDVIVANYDEIIKSVSKKSEEHIRLYELISDEYSHLIDREYDGS